MASIDKNHERYRHSQDTAWRRVESEGVILDLKTSQYYSLNESAAFIWEKLGSSVSVPEIAAQLCREFDVSPSTAARDIEKMVEAFCKEKLLTRAASKKR